MYAAAPGKCEIKPVGANISRGTVISRLGWLGMFTIGGPLEERGRLRYIDGCTDSLLVPPVRLGDPCLNGLWFPMGTEQTSHTHPSVRIGMVVRGRGQCVTPSGVQDLRPGMVFVIHAEGEHRFRTEHDAGLTVVAWHPDSDTGPTDVDHPMVNRTMVAGVSAAAMPELQTR
jgi:mannose-6-phosphate isomerase-like protein (cupin superfamily)